MSNIDQRHQDLELRSISSAGHSAKPGLSDVPGVSQRQQSPTTMTNKKKDPLFELASGITIAGIEDAYKAKTKLERYTYVGAVLFGLLAMMYSSVGIANRYWRADPIAINRAEILIETAPFPNVTICLPQMKNPRINELAVFPQKALELMQKHNVSVEEMLQFMEFGKSAFYGDKEKEGPLKTAIGTQIVDASLDVNDQFIVDAMKAPCEKSFFECTFGGNSFDCCSVATYMLLDQGSCWHFDINTVERRGSSNSIKSTYRSQLTPSGLEIDIVIDTRLVIPDDNVLPDGFIVHIDQIPSLFSSPEVIPFGADAHIILSEPKHINQIAQCQSNEKLPDLTRLDYYDPNGIFCTMEKTLDLFLNGIGCDPVPFLTFIPSNETRCEAEMTLFLLRVLGGEMTDFSASLVPMATDLPTRTQTFDQKGFESIRDRFRSCQPLCNRWSYSVFSSSYGYIQYRQDMQDTYENVSMTRLSVYFQDSAYQQRTEEYSDRFYLAFCEIGGVWGVYLGLSIITVLQTIAYVFLLWRMRKELRVRVASSSGKDNEAIDGDGGSASKEPPKCGPPRERKQAWV